MCIACEMDFWLVSDELAPEQPAAFQCDMPEDEAQEIPKPASEPRE